MGICCHKCDGKLRSEMKVLIIVSGRIRAEDKEQGGGVIVVFMRSTGKANRQTPIKRE